VQNSWLLGSAASRAAVVIDLANTGQLLLLAGIAIVIYLWLLDKVASS
jgi:hypothetical protein